MRREVITWYANERNEREREGFAEKQCLLDYDENKKINEQIKFLLKKYILMNQFMLAVSAKQLYFTIIFVKTKYLYRHYSSYIYIKKGEKV